MIERLLKTALPAAALAIATFTAGAASAVSSFVIEDFGTGNLPDPYVSQGFTYSPIYDNNGQCYNGRCLQDKNGSGEGLVTTQSIASGADFTAYNFLGLYLNVNGKVQAGQNFLDVGGILLPILTDISSYVDLYYTDGSSVLDGKITFDATGFFVIFKDPLVNVASVTFEALNSGQVRLDCMLMSTDGTSSATFADFNGCVPDVDGGGSGFEIPLPAGLPLIGTAIGAFAFASRRRKSKKA